MPASSTREVLTREGSVVRGLSDSCSSLSHLSNLMLFSREVWESCWGKCVQLMIDLDREVKFVLARGESCHVWGMYYLINTQMCLSFSRQLYITTTQPAAVTPWHSTATQDTSYATDLKTSGTGIRRQWLSWSKQQWLALQRLVSTVWEFVGESQQRSLFKALNLDILESSFCGSGSKILPICLHL